MPHASSDYAAGVKMQRQVRPAVATLFPSRNFVVLRAQSLAYRIFGYLAIGPSGSRRNVAFCVQTLAKFLVRTAHMFVESMSAASFIARQIISRRVIVRSTRNASFSAGHFAARYFGQTRIRRRTASADPEQ
jgi:hypothetical protein